MLVPQGTVEEVFKTPEVDGSKRPLFSIAAANPSQSIQLGQLVPGTFGWEDRQSLQYPALLVLSGEIEQSSVLCCVARL
jgi:hypothetical protein